jgi:predicted membrane-bound spermidine synthase
MQKETEMPKQLSAISPISYLYFALFFISGVSGLIYESIWSQYLKQFLGHAAYAQTLVLVIYMGGMALGAWLTSIWAVKIRNLLLGYAVVEIALALSAFIFHDVFVAYLNTSFDTVIPSLGSPLPISIYKWGTAALIILPQSMMLGATFPLMAGGILRRFPGLSGYKTSVIYFVNTFGASIGVLVSGFYLVKEWGLKGAIIAGGVIDLFVGVSILCLWLYDRNALNKGAIKTAADRKTPKKAKVAINSAVADEHGSSPHKVNDTSNTICTNIPTPDLADRRNYYYPLLAIAGLTALSSFIYEIAWIRMLSLVLGSSTHSFELMLSAFILGLALGSFFIRNRLDNIKNAPRFLAIVQIIMGATAIATLFTYGNMFKIMSFAMTALNKTGEGYLLFNVISHVICMLIMLPSTICAGMVVPLIIHMLYRRGYGEQTIGKVYAVNTAGGILGVVIAVWVLMESVGLKYLIIVGGAIDLAIGLYVFHHFRESRGRLTRIVAVPACLAVLIAASVFGKIDSVLISSGVFRFGTIPTDRNIIAHVDGKTASITLLETENTISLTTNGKPDASVGIGRHITTDEHTMALLGALPLAVLEARTAAVIGLGAGMTTHYMLYDTMIERLDVIEIEPAMLSLAQMVGPKVANTFNDPRCRIYIEDAKTFFSSRSRSYDVIVSEPSNPWVSGVASLFSKEFFRHIRRYINDGGVLIQWFHLYETDITILASILKALHESFPIYDVYAVGTDLLIVAAKDTAADISVKRDIFKIAPMAQSLAALGFADLDDFRLLRIANGTFLNPFINTYDAPPNSDFHSFVNIYSSKHRFMGRQIAELNQLRDFIVPIIKIIESDTGYLRVSPDNRHAIHNARAMAREFKTNALTDTVKGFVPEPVHTLNYASAHPEKMTFPQIRATILKILETTLPHLSVGEMRELWDIIENMVSTRQLLESEARWMAYFKSLCYYDLPEMFRLSLELLPAEGTISNHPSNQMLLASMLAAAIAQSDTVDWMDVGRVWTRYAGNMNPPAPLRAAMALTVDIKNRR